MQIFYQSIIPLPKFERVTNKPDGDRLSGAEHTKRIPLTLAVRRLQSGSRLDGMFKP
jgi:hypothetical protein